jgi:hypothetical protein
MSKSMNPFSKLLSSVLAVAPLPTPRKLHTHRLVMSSACDWQGSTSEEEKGEPARRRWCASHPLAFFHGRIEFPAPPPPPTPLSRLAFGCTLIFRGEPEKISSSEKSS